jgi:acyl-CoA dehydrogenase
VSLVVVETADCAGFVRGRILDKVGQHGADTSELFFDDVRVPIDNLLGGVEGQGFGQLMTQLAQERLIIGVTAVATMESAVDETVAYVKSREAFGHTLFDFQNTKFTLAECQTTAHVARVFLDSCIERHLRGELDSTTAAMAKWWLTEQPCQVVDRCVQLFGGYGYMREYPIARMFADSRVQKIYGGSNEIMKDLIARSL